MKRSEMEARLIVCIKLMKACGLDNEQSAAYLLEQIEQLGMKPPAYKAMDNRTGLFHGYDCYEWESEDSGEEE